MVICCCRGRREAEGEAATRKQEAKWSRDVRRERGKAWQQQWWVCGAALRFGEGRRNAKLHVWEELSYMVGLCEVPSCYMGDFNEIMHVEERQGTDILPRSTEEFRSWVQDMHLVDLPLTDRKFTWFRGRSCSRIDRALVSVEWLEEFPETRICDGPRDLSDHCPEEWRGLGEMQFIDKLKALTIPLGNWNKTNFGDMDKKITRFEEEIKKIDDLVSNGVYDGMMEARRKTLVTCCERWLVRNQARIKIAIKDYYKELYHQDKSPMMSFRDGLVNRMEHGDSVSMEALPTAEEIREAVWDCESSKAPGYDGYNMNFVKRCWGDIGPKFTAAVMGFFQTSRLPTDSNITWVALTPKFIGAKEIKDL
ncbi:uncharacterized protein LOC130975138 [Arachis stenosperma]|uniref:uncharacterized protein LOC130975138 n=1 Tax=Arachis stenosperma TaxID=217475 RepID=UPI0025ABEBE5|nr:uncharacterized protein LOC130975138 [Arachis stenosperma]